MTIQDYPNFQTFLKNTYSEPEYALLQALCRLLEGKSDDAITEADITLQANLPEARLYRYFPDGKSALVKTFLAALIQYCEQVVFYPLTASEKADTEVLKTLLKRFAACQEMTLILQLNTHHYRGQLNEYYFLWEMLLVNFLYKDAKSKPNMAVVKESIALIHHPWLMQWLWHKKSDISHVTYHLRNLWYQAKGEIRNELACSDIPLPASGFIPDNNNA